MPQMNNFSRFDVYTVTSSNSQTLFTSGLVPRLSHAKAGRWPGNEANSPVNLGFANAARKILDLSSGHLC